MDRHARLALMRQHFDQLVKLCDPAKVSEWLPTETQRLAYAQLLDKILNGVDAHKSSEKREILSSGRTQTDTSDSGSLFLLQELEPRIPVLKAAYHYIDPSGAELYELLEGIGGPRGAGERVRATFDEALQQVYDLIDRNPDQHFRLLPDAAYEIFDSKLIAFEPDAWLQRAGDLTQIRIARKNVLLPVHVRLRLEELFRTYVLGCWLSVFALARAILEYATLDNLHKFQVDRQWPAGRDGKRRDKKLEQLIDEVAVYLPELLEPMSKLRTYGNEYLHPRPSRTSKESLFQREKAAKDALETVVLVVELLYRATKQDA